MENPLVQMLSKKINNDSQRFDEKKQDLRQKILQQKEMNTLINKFQQQVETIPYKAKAQEEKNDSKSLPKSKEVNISNEEWLKLLLKSNLEFMSYNHFSYLIQHPTILNLVARELHHTRSERVDGKGQIIKSNLLELEDILSRCQKDQFLDFRNGEITYDQLQSRIAQRQGIAEYKIFDDVKKDLHPSIVQDLDKYDKVMSLLYKGKDKIDHKDLLKPLEDWQANLRCLKTIQYHHNKNLNVIESLWDRQLNKGENDKKLFKNIDTLVNAKIDLNSNDFKNKSKKKKKINIGPPNNRKEETFEISANILDKYLKLPGLASNDLTKQQIFITQKQKTPKLRDESGLNFNRKLKSPSQKLEINQNSQLESKGQNLSTKKLFKNKRQSGVSQDEEIQIKLRKKQEQELQEQKQSLIFLKNISQHCNNLQINQQVKDLLELKDDIELAMRQDMASDDEDEQKLQKDATMTNLNKLTIKKNMSIQQNSLHTIQTDRFRLILLKKIQNYKD
eukprot:403335764